MIGILIFILGSFKLYYVWKLSYLMCKMSRLVKVNDLDMPVPVTVDRLKWAYICLTANINISKYTSHIEVTYTQILNDERIICWKAAI